MIPLPGLPYLFLATALASGAASGIVVYKIDQGEIASLERGIAQGERDAQAMRADYEARARVKEAADAEKSRNIEEQHNEALAAAAHTRDDFAKRLSDARAKANTHCLSGPATDTASGAPVAPGSNGPVGAVDPGLSLRDAVRVLQAYAVACHSFAETSGR